MYNMVNGKRRGWSWSNIPKNLTKFYNHGLAPVLGSPPIQMYDDARKLEAAREANMRNKVYKEGEQIPQVLHLLDGRHYGDGSGRTWAEGGRVPCKDRYDGRIPDTVCYLFRKKKGQKFVEGKGFMPRFVDP